MATLLGLAARALVRPREEPPPFRPALTRQLAGLLGMGLPLVTLVHVGMGSFLSLDGFFERAGRIVVGRAKTRRRLIGAIVWGAGLLGAVVTNDAVCVLLAPLVVE